MKKGILKNQEKCLSKPDPKSVTTAKSLMDTAKKNGQSAFNVIRAIAYPKAIADGVYLQF